jgi:hypothetical protein
MTESYQVVLYVLCFVIPVEYTAIAFASLVSKIVVLNFVNDLNEASRSRETKQECQKMAVSVRARYRQSLLWPLEIWRSLYGSK